MLDNGLKELGEAAHHPAFILGYEHPALLEALVELGSGHTAPYETIDRDSLYNAILASIDKTSIPSRVFSIARNKTALEGVLAIAQEIDVAVFVISAGARFPQHVVWSSLNGLDTSFRNVLSTAKSRDLKPFLEVLSWRQPDRRLRVLLD